ncbi:LysR family transcriptional regulator [Lysobacter pythonis]|uniref:LysR family transcriptional regulator n=1 Tax=Solilutibacter pythonis TaxID=2483112 RepID=A0A3M2I3B1_9GAMM|nr:LysR substrate-binding domain-containing protein [Lysobacter pythonis]RMH94815.1 LysR family transcriptional regulator [Lysobacter pythonis]
MTLTQLRYLVAIVDAGLNISQAALRVHATQPVLSRQLKQLEDELGLQLFSRKGRSLQAITPAGGEVVQHARRLLREADNIRQLAANQRGEGEGRLTLVTTHTQARFVLPPAISMVKQRWPRVSVHLQPAGDAEILGLLAEGEADLALISTSGRAPDAGIAIPLYRWRRKLLMPKTHPLATKPELTMVDLARAPLVSYESSLRAASSLQRAFARAGVVANIAMTAADADLIKTYVRTGLGIGLLAEMAVGAQEADLAVREAPTEIPANIAWAVLPRERVMRDYTTALLLALAPQLDRHDLQRTVAGHQPPDWPPPPSWVALSQSITC